MERFAAEDEFHRFGLKNPVPIGKLIQKGCSPTQTYHIYVGCSTLQYHPHHTHTPPHTIRTRPRPPSSPPCVCVCATMDPLWQSTNPRNPNPTPSPNPNPNPDYFCCGIQPRCELRVPALAGLQAPVRASVYISARKWRHFCFHIHSQQRL